MLSAPHGSWGGLVGIWASVAGAVDWCGRLSLGLASLLDATGRGPATYGLARSVAPARPAHTPETPPDLPIWLLRFGSRGPVHS